MTGSVAARRRGPMGAAAVALSVGLVATSACSPEVAADEVPRAEANAGLPAAPTAIEPTTTTSRAMIRDGDITDVAELSRQMSAEARGDAEWIAVVADLRSRSWLAARYPGRYELTDIYSAAWAAENAAPLEAETLELGLYVDEPLPILESVVVTRTLGQLVEVEVVIRSEQASVRQTATDAVVTVLPGGRRRGLFSLGPATTDDVDRPWRIHSIAELTPPVDSETTTSTEANE